MSYNFLNPTARDAERSVNVLSPKVLLYAQNNSTIDTTDVTNNLFQSEDPPVMSPAPMDSILMEHGARTAMFAQAERMVKKSRLDIPHGHPGDNIAVPIPLVDRGRCDRISLTITKTTSTYTICVKSGIIKSKYSCNQFDLCPQRLLQESDVDSTKTITVRQAVAQDSTSEGQGYMKCNCQG